MNTFINDSSVKVNNSTIIVDICNKDFTTTFKEMFNLGILNNDNSLGSHFINYKINGLTLLIQINNVKYIKNIIEQNGSYYNKFLFCLYNDKNKIALDNLNMLLSLFEFSCKHTSCKLFTEFELIGSSCMRCYKGNVAVDQNEINLSGLADFTIKFNNAYILEVNKICETKIPEKNMYGCDYDSDDEPNNLFDFNDFSKTKPNFDFKFDENDDEYADEDILIS